MNKNIILYNNIMYSLKKNQLSIVKIADILDLRKQTVSYRLLNIKRKGIINLNFINEIEKLTGEIYLKI